MKCKTCGVEGHDSQGHKELCLMAVVARLERLDAMLLEESAAKAKYIAERDVARRAWDDTNLQICELQEMNIRQAKIANKLLQEHVEEKDAALRLNGEYRAALEEIARIDARDYAMFGPRVALVAVQVAKKALAEKPVGDGCGCFHPNDEAHKVLCHCDCHKTLKRKGEVDGA